MPKTPKKETSPSPIHLSEAEEEELWQRWEDYRKSREADAIWEELKDEIDSWMKK